MPTTITANSNTLVKTVTAPQDGVDNVEQSSVNPAFQGILNNTYVLARRDAFTRPQISIQCLDGTSITIQPFDGLWASKTTPVEDYVPLYRENSFTINATDIEGGGGYVANTVYYIYAFYDPAATNQTKVQLSADPLFPDPTLTFKRVGGVSQITHRYLGSCICVDVAGTPTILPYRQTGLIYTISGKFGSTNYTAAPMASGVTFNDVIFTNLPITAKAVDTTFWYLNDTAADGRLFFTSKGTEGILTTSDYDSLAPTGATRRLFLKTMSTGTSNRCSSKLEPADANRNTYIFWTGYRE